MVGQEELVGLAAANGVVWLQWLAGLVELVGRAGRVRYRMICWASRATNANRA